MTRALSCLSAMLLMTLAVAAQQPFDQQGRPNRNQPGPWDNDVLVYRVGTAGAGEQIATFPRAGVPTVARLDATGPPRRRL